LDDTDLKEKMIYWNCELHDIKKFSFEDWKKESLKLKDVNIVDITFAMKENRFEYLDEVYDIK